MSLTLSGKLIGIASSQFTDRATGEVTNTYMAEILHKQANRHDVDSVKIDQSTLPEWQKVIGKNLYIEVRPYAISRKEGGIMQGFSLADKKQLPTVATSQSSN